MPTQDNQLAILSSGAADWDADLDANFAVIERGYHISEHAGQAISSGQVLALNSGGFFKPYDPTVTSMPPVAYAFTAAASGDSMQALAWGIVRSLDVNSLGAPGKVAYATLSGYLTTVASGFPVGIFTTGRGILFNPDHGSGGGGGGVTKVLSLSDVDPAGLADGSILKWSNASSKFTMQVDSSGAGGSSVTVGAKPSIVQINTLETTASSAAFTFASTPTAGNLILFFATGNNDFGPKDDGVTNEFTQFGATYNSNPQVCVFKHVSDGRKSYAWGDSGANDFVVYGMEIANAGEIYYKGLAQLGQFKITSGDHLTGPTVYSRWGNTLAFCGLSESACYSSTVNSGWGLAWGINGGPQAKMALAVMSNALAAGSSYYCNWTIIPGAAATKKAVLNVIVNPIITF